MSAPAERLLLLLENCVATLKSRQPDYADALDFQAMLIRTALTTARAPELQTFALPREHLETRLRQGIPLLHDQPITLDVPFAAELFSRLVNTLIDRNVAETDARLELLVAAATGGQLDPPQLFGEAFVQHADHVAPIATQAGVDPEMLGALAHQAVAPILRAYAERLLPMLDRVDDGSIDSAAWKHGYCPICGGWPMLGELRGIEPAQWLRCSGCGSGWRAPRLVCPYCANDDERTLGSLTIEGEPRFHVAVCERCKGYLKVGNAFDPLPADLVALDDTITLHLDVAATDRGYQRPSGSGYRIELAVPEDEWLEELA
jgi:FdhE protein